MKRSDHVKYQIGKYTVEITVTETKRKTRKRARARGGAIVPKLARKGTKKSALDGSKMRLQLASVRPGNTGKVTGLTLPR